MSTSDSEVKWHENWNLRKIKLYLIKTQSTHLRKLCKVRRGWWRFTHFRRVAGVWEGVFVLIRIFLNSGKYCERQRREPLWVSWGKLLPQKMLKPGNAIFSSLHVNISNSIKSKKTGIFSHNNNISVWLGAFTHSDTYRLSTPNVLQNSTCAARYLGARA